MAISGGLTKQITTDRTGTMASAGAAVKQLARLLAGTVSSSGVVGAIRTVLLSLTGTLASSGTLLRRTSTSFAATIAPNATLIRQIGKLVSGGLGAQSCLRYYAGGNLSNVDKTYIRCAEPSNALNVGAGDFTLEWWVLADASNTSTGVTAGANYSWIQGNIMVDRDLVGSNGAGGDWGCSLDDGRVAFGVEDSIGTQYTIIGTTDLRDGAWHHVAVTYTYANGDIAIYVDGAREAQQLDAVPNNSNLSYDDARTPSTYDPFLCLGGEKHAIDWPQGQFAGRIDEFRVSDTRRYTGATYTIPTAPFLPDANAKGIFHFDEGAGTVVRDHSGNGLDGSFTVGGSGPGPAWVLSGAPLARMISALTALKTVLISLAGAVTSAGVLTKRTARSLTAAVASSATLVKSTSRILTATVTMAGAVAALKTVLISLAGTLTSVGVVVRQTGKTFTGSLALNAVLARAIARSLTGGTAMAGTLVRQTRRLLTGVLSWIGGLTTFQTSGGGPLTIRLVRVTLTSPSLAALTIDGAELRNLTAMTIDGQG